MAGFPPAWPVDARPGIGYNAVHPRHAEVVAVYSRLRWTGLRRNALVRCLLLAGGGLACVGSLLGRLSWAQPPEPSPPQPPAGLRLVAEPDAIPADGRHSSRLTARWLPAAGRPVAGRRIRFATTAGWLTNTEGVTDERGRAQTFLVSDTEPGTATVTARCDCQTATATVVFREDDGTIILQQQPAPTVSLSAHWWPTAGQPGYQCEYNGGTLSGGPQEFKFNVYWHYFPILGVWLN